MGFTAFGLSDHIMQGVRAAGHTVPTPIQSLAIRPALEGKDIVGCAQTGTGKTAAFILPILQRLGTPDRSAERNRYPRALVLTPTRELAQQVQNAAAMYGRFLSLRSVSIYGGVSMGNQLNVLRRGADIIVATPGRLLDHLQRKTVDLSRIEVLVLDEADRMLDMGFIHDVRKVIEKIPNERQTFLFSATLSSEITSLAGRFLRDPQTVEAGEKRNPVESIAQHFYATPQEAKLHLLLQVLQEDGMESVLVFSRTKHGADKIRRRLDASGVTSVAIHSDRTQGQRERALEGFKRGEFRVLVATDIAARGIDVTGISHVVNFDIPRYAEDYIHRIGRTGRAGAAGIAMTFVGRDEQQFLRRIEQYTGKRFSVKEYPGFVPPKPKAAPDAPPRDRVRTEKSRPGTDPRDRVRAEKSRPGTDPRDRVRAEKSRPGNDRPHRKKGLPVPVRKRKYGAAKLDSFSSDTGGASWSNY
jgi:ATP-dependent RNA helicase RhlE